MNTLQGKWRVRRVSGLLPPGFTKQIGATEGRTLFLGIPIGRFHLDGRRLVYRRWPVVDEIEQRPDGVLMGRGRIFGVAFCHFRLEPL